MVASERSSSFSPFHSLKAIVARSGPKQIYGVYERPPFPIIVDQPTLKDIVTSWRFSDFVMAGTIYGVGLVGAYWASRPMVMLQQRLVTYHFLSHTALYVAAYLMVIIPYRRLTGYWDNGLRWKKPEDRLRKYDNTSYYEKATVWGRINPSNNWDYS